MEAMASGTAVIAYRKGGLTETIIEGVTGTFFATQDAKTLAAILDGFDASDFKQADLLKQAQRFSTKTFRKLIYGLYQMADMYRL